MCSPLGHRKQRRQVLVPDSLLQMRRGDKALDSNSGSPSRTLRPPGSAPGSALDRAPTGTCAGALPSAGGVLLPRSSLDYWRGCRSRTGFCSGSSLAGGMNSGRWSVGLSLICQGVLWIIVWCARHSRAMLASEVGPPSIHVGDVVGVAGDGWPTAA